LIFYLTDFKGLTGYRQVAQCLGQNYKGRKICNTIYVRDDLLKTVYNLQPDLDITCSCLTKRCATSISIKGIKLVNLHLCGGRFDYNKYQEQLDTKKCQIQRSIDSLQPDLIVGDFNSEAEFEQLEAYDFYQELNPTQQQTFMQYLTSHYQPLSGNNFQTAYRRDQVGSTTSFGNTVDWIYYKPNRLVPIAVQIFETISKQMSDHNGVLVAFKKSPH